jgi:hypothetical protein
MLVMGCEAILGTYDVLPAQAGFEAGPGDLPDGSLADTSTTVDGASPDAGPPPRACETASDCQSAPMSPAGCAIATCKQGTCAFVANDKDGDGHPGAGCSVSGAPLPGDDCADESPTVFPGGACTKRPDGSDIFFPNGTPLGACKVGHWDCVAGRPACTGAVEPKPADDCAVPGNDANCNGTAGDGCACMPGATERCGNIAGLPLPCTSGSRTCTPQGKWGLCVGNVEMKPRDCSSNVDNNCNGSPDFSENACACPGPVAQGKPAPCSVAGAQGVCVDGSHTCVPSPDKQTGIFDACKGPAPGAVDCASTLDNDCNGTSDELEVKCDSPCLDPLGSGKGVAAAQKFSKAMWGCPGVRNFSAARAGCGLGSQACLTDTWIAHIRTLKAKTPTRQYWLADAPNNFDGKDLSCIASPKAFNACKPGTGVAVCTDNAGNKDADGNYCDSVTGCSFQSEPGPNDSLGACVSTAGTLCCY